MAVTAAARKGQSTGSAAKIAHRVLDSANRQSIGAGLCALAVMTKAPRAGQVKTRLVPPLTAEEAAALNVCFLRDIAGAISQVVASGQAAGVGVYTPLGAEAEYQGILPENFFLLPQRGKPFGDRLSNAAEDLFTLGFKAVCLINSDSPTVSPSAFVEATQVLSRPGDRVILGPSADGGYYLIGLKDLHRRLFQQIDWSTEEVLRQTLQCAAELHLEVHLLPPAFDVDDRIMLRQLCAEIFAGSSQNSDIAPATRACLAQIIEREGRSRIWPNESNA